MNPVKKIRKTREQAGVRPEEGSSTRGHLMDAAYGLIKERLLEGKYEPGDRVSPDEVMTQIGASRQPVMEALRRLEAEGFVRIIPQSGCLVATPDPEQIDDFLHLLAAIEGTCAELVCERATDEELDRLRDIAARFKARLATLSPDTDLGHEYRLHNREFHNLMYAIAHSPIARDLAAGMSDRADFYISNAVTGTHSFGGRVWEAVEEHRRIAEILSWRDPVAARRFVEAHVVAFSSTAKSGAACADEGRAPVQRRSTVVSTR